MIHSLGSRRLQALHIHDNCFDKDIHTLPFLGKIPFPDVMKALHNIDYKGDLTFEADNFIKNLPN